MKFYHFFKRIVDIVISLIGVILLIPLFLVLTVWIKISSKGPAVYKHTRIGKNGKPFNIYKFRSMVVGARDLQEQNVLDKDIITSSGKTIRKSFFDELLQLFNVLKGDMSLVGPRPFDKEFFSKSTKRDKKWKSLLKIKPGLTSIASVASYLSRKEYLKFEMLFKGLFEKDTAKYDSYEHDYILDEYYIDNESLFLDIKILFYTFFLMVKKIFK